MTQKKPVSSWRLREKPVEEHHDLNDNNAADDFVSNLELPNLNFDEADEPVSNPHHLSPDPEPNEEAFDDDEDDDVPLVTQGTNDDMRMTSSIFPWTWMSTKLQ